MASAARLVLAESFDFAEVDFPLVGTGGDDEDGDVSGGGVEDDTDRPGLGGHGEQEKYPAAVRLGPGLFGHGKALSGPFVEACEYRVGSVYLIADRSEVLADPGRGRYPG
jgi:hypothetical protein